MIETLATNPLLLLFLVASIGYFLGNIKIKGSSLGVSAVLFTGLFIGSLNSNFQIPEVILLLGLSIFVYSIGLSSGPAFFKSYKKNGIRDFLFIISMLSLTGVVAILLYFVFGFSPSTITGAYAGSTTNTPALAGVIDYITNTCNATDGSNYIQQTVVGYSFSYPMGVLGAMIVIIIMEKVFKIDYAEEQKSLSKIYPSGERLRSINIEIENHEICNIPFRDLNKKYNWAVNFTRIYQGNELGLVNYDTKFKLGDMVIIVGPIEETKKVVDILGKHTKSPLAYDRTVYDVRRIFVSNQEVVGRTLASLNISEKYDATITRIRRGDLDMMALGDTVLELGDRIRFIAQRKDLNELSEFFGDSYTASSKVNLFSFGLGIGLGLLLGSIEFSLGSSFSFKLGYAGGPLIVGLILGALRRTGPIVWALPYSANVTLQQIGLILLLSAIGVRSGNAFIDSLSIEAVWILIASAIISILTAFFMIFIGYKILKMPFSLLLGMVSNQPAILDFAASRTNNKIPEYGYAMIFPIALIGKIVIAQLLFLFLQ